MPPRAGRLQALHGAERLDSDPNLARWSLNPVADTEVSAPVDNACYLGHVVAFDTVGRHAREHAERAVAQLSFAYHD